MATRTTEPLAWLLFSAGGVLSALTLPVLALLVGVAFPLGWIAPPSHASLAILAGNPLTRLGLWILVVLALAHWAHRFRYTLYDGLQIKHLNEVINLACYGGALAGSIWAAIVLARG